MMSRFLFLVKEGFVGLGRSRASATVAVLTIAVSLVLIGIFLIVTINLSDFVEELKNRVEITVFLDDSFVEEKTLRIRDQISGLPGIRSVNYASKEKAVAEFRERSQQLEVDYFEILGFNPLPASFRLQLEPEFLTIGSLNQIVQQLSAIEGIDDRDVTYEKGVLILIEGRLKAVVLLAVVVGTVLCLGALLLVSNTVRLIILSREKLIATMQLVGATRLFVQTPMFIQGSLQGLLGGLVAILFLFMLVEALSFQIPDLISIDVRVSGLVVCLGVALGFLGSAVAVQRYL